MSLCRETAKLVDDRLLHQRRVDGPWSRAEKGFDRVGLFVWWRHVWLRRNTLADILPAAICNVGSRPDQRAVKLFQRGRLPPVIGVEKRHELATRALQTQVASRIRSDPSGVKQGNPSAVSFRQARSNAR